jgi:hypothetical protein
LSLKGAWANVEVFNALIQEMQVKGRLELGAIIGLNSFNLERHPGCGVVIELDGRLQITVGIEPEHPKPCAIIDGGELVELLAPARAWDGIDELHLNLNLMTR